ncbi:hypothetical protein ASF77_16780 [Massilia sp. Leaf139]|nr:hypothetical protein ASF77_16780 [Massilia sp. Leaf139]
MGPLYDFTLLGLPGISYGDVFRQGIASGGLVAGTSYDAAGNPHAFFYNGKTNIDLGSFGGNYGRAFSVNRCGQVAGWALNAAGLPHGFLYNGTLHDLGTLGGPDSYGNAISTCGRVVGWATNALGQTHAFYHDSAGMRDLGTFGGTGSYALAVNAVGQAVGYAYGPNNAWYRAFVYDARTGAPIQDLGGSAGNSLAQDINDAGQVVGYTRDGTGLLRAFRYEAGTLHDLGLLPGAEGAEARAINATGKVVGYAYFAGGRRAFLHDGSTLRDLGSLGDSSYSDAVAINAAGLAVGSSLSPAAGAEHAVAWGPAYGIVDLNERVKDLPAGTVLTMALAVADDGAIVVRTNGGLGLLRPRK